MKLDGSVRSDLSPVNPDVRPKSERGKKQRMMKEKKKEKENSSRAAFV